MKKLLIALFLISILFIGGCIGGESEKKEPLTKATSSTSTTSTTGYIASEETGIVSGRFLYDNLKPVYDASVLVNGKPAEIYGTTYLALGVSAGEVAVEARDSEGQTRTETLIVEPSVVNSVDLIFPSGEGGTSPEVTTTSNHIQFSWNNGLSLELNLEDDELLGIGEVKVNEIPLRKPSITGTPTIEKIENGKFVEIEYEKCLFVDYETKGETVIVHSKLITVDGDVNLDWVFAPWEMEVEGNQYTGLGYRFSIDSPVDISKMGFNCSWELNEDISGKTLLIRREKTAWERDCTQSEGFRIRAPALLSQSQPPDYQYDGSGALASFIWPPGELENTLQKDSGSDQLWFYDKFSFGETKQAETPFRVILYTSKGGLDEYTYLFDKVSENYRKFYGLEEVVPVPTVLASYAIQDAIKPGEAPLFRDAADNYFPEFADHNFKQTLIIYLWLSNGRIGAPYNGNRLATHSIDFHPDDIGELKYLADKTHELGMKFAVWLSTCFSKNSSLYEINDWMIQNVDGTFPDAASHDVYLMSYRSGYLGYALERLAAVKDEFGFDGLWHDSFGAALRIDYSGESIESGINQQMQFLSATQRIGYVPYTESLGPFGMTAVGSSAVTISDAPGAKRDINTAFGGREYLAYKTSFILFHADDFSPLQVNYYKFLANKGVPMLAYDKLSEAEKEDVSKANKDYNTASTYMDKRHLLPDDKGVLWYDKESNTQILFAYSAFSYELEGGITQVFDITANTGVEITNGSFTTQTEHTYKLQ